MESKIVLFDLDKTLLRTTSSFQFGTFLYRRNYFSFFKMVKLLGFYLGHKSGLLSIADLHQKVFESLFLGRCQLEISRLADTFLDAHFEGMLYAPALARLRQAKEEGHYTAICSSSPFFLVESIAKRLGVNEWMATAYACNEWQKFHALSKIVEGEEKADFAQALAKKLQIPLERVAAYTDSMHDLPFLEAVGEKVGVNPDRVLRQLCLKNNWEII